MSTSVNFPYQFDGRGRTADAMQDYVRQLVEQVLFTSPGERVNLPDFGSGLLQLPFALNSVEMAAATQFTVQGALQKWLSNYIKVQSVVATANEGTLTVTVSYSMLNTRCHPGPDLRLRREPVIYKCCDEKRKAAVLGNPTLNGIDYLEVLGFDAQPLGLAPQTILLVRCLKAAPTTLTPDNILISGGESITNIKATFITPATLRLQP